MKTIKIRVPNKPYSKEWAVIGAVAKLANKMEKETGVNVEYGQGGTLDDWKEPDLGGNKDGLLMVLRVSLKGEDAIKEAERMYRRAMAKYKNASILEQIGTPNGYPLGIATMYLDKAKNLLKQA